MAQYKNIALIGASGRIGSAILPALLNEDFKVTIISRASSIAKFPPGVRVLRVSDEYSVPDLTKVLEGQDAVVSAIANAQSLQQRNLIDAARLAGVKRFIPSQFGSVPNEKGLAVLPMYYIGKLETVEHLKKSENDMSWTAIMTGPVFDIGMKGNILGFDIKEHKATIYNSGFIRWSTTTLDTIGLAVKRVLLMPEATANRYLYIHSFTLTDQEILDACEKITRKKWDVDHADAEEQKLLGQQNIQDGNVFPGLVRLLKYSRSVPGFGLDHGETRESANGLLGLPKETLEASLGRILL